MVKQSPKIENRGEVFVWTLYDWAVSAFTTTVMAGFFPLFFKDFYDPSEAATVSTARLGGANSVAALLMGLVAPVLGAIADKGRSKKRFLFFFCLLGAALTASLALVNEGDWLLAAALYALAAFAQSASFIFYDALLPSITKRQNVDYVSALGYAFGYLGGGVVFAVNVWMYLQPAFFGLADQVAAVKASFIMVAAWWVLFALPLAFVETKRQAEETATEKKPISTSVKEGLREFAGTVRHVKHYKTLFLFLAAFLLYNDGVSTTIKMAVDYGMAIGFATQDLIIALLLVQFVGVPATFAYGKLFSYFSPKSGIYTAIAVYLLAVVWGAWMDSSWEFYGLAVLIGLVQGGIQSLSRSFYARLIPAQKEAEFFGLYNLLGRFSGIVGPLLMGALGLATGESRWTLAGIAVFFVAGGALLLAVQEEKAVEELHARGERPVHEA